MIAVKRERIMKAYASMTGEYGELPTALEIAEAAHVSPTYVYNVMQDAQLPYRALQQYGRKKGGWDRKAAKPEREESFALPSHARIRELLMSGQAEQRGDALARAGEANAVTDRIFLTCPVCGRRALIAPRMHPFWLRNRAGEVIFVCRAACAGIEGLNV